MRWILQRHVICVALSDLSIAVYSSEDMSLAFRLPVFTYPQTIFWSEEAGLLYCGGADGGIRVYNLDTRSIVQTIYKVRHSEHTPLQKGGGVSPVCCDWQHEDVVTCFAVIPRHNLLVSAGLDSKILLWDLGGQHKFRGRLRGFNRGVRVVVYASDHELLLAAGFEYHGMAWDVNTNGLLMKYVCTCRAGWLARGLGGLTCYCAGLAVTDLRWWEYNSCLATHSLL